MPQTKLQLSDKDRLAIGEICSKGVHTSREVDRAHILACLGRELPMPQIMAAREMGPRLCAVQGGWLRRR